MQVSLSFRTLPLLFHVIFFSFTSAVTVSNSTETSFHKPFGLAWSHASWELCPLLLPADCCHRGFVVPYHSLLFHLSLVVFLTLDSLFLLWDEHQDDRDTLCIVPELKEATASGNTNHSSQLSSSSSSPSEEECAKFSLTLHPSISLFNSPLLVCGVGPLPPMSTCTTSVCVFLHKVVQ